MLGSLNLRYTRGNAYGLKGSFASGGWDDFTGPNQKHFLRTNVAVSYLFKLKTI